MLVAGVGLTPGWCCQLGHAGLLQIHQQHEPRCWCAFGTEIQASPALPDASQIRSSNLEVWCYWLPWNPASTSAALPTSTFLASREMGTWGIPVLISLLSSLCPWHNVMTPWLSLSLCGVSVSVSQNERAFKGWLGRTSWAAASSSVSLGIVCVKAFLLLSSSEGFVSLRAGTMSQVLGVCLHLLSYFWRYFSIWFDSLKPAKRKNVAGL